MAEPAVRRLSRLLVALPSTRMGGTERHTAALCTHLAGRGLAVTLAAEPALHDALRPHLGPGVALEAAAIGPEAAGADANEARQAAEGARLIAGHAPDMALLPLPWPDAGLGLMRALAAAGLPRVVLAHLADDGPVPAAVAAARGAIGASGCALAAVSAPTAFRIARAFGVPAARVAVLPNPAPAPAALDRAMVRATMRSSFGLAPEAGLVLFVGRLEEAKGADLLPAVSGRLGAVLACLGDGPLRGLLEARAADDPRGLLRVIGPVADAGTWYLAADALLLPSRREGAPLVFLEAAAHRCPVVATEAALEALDDRMFDLARIAEAEPGALAAALEGVLADPAGTAGMVEAAAAHAARQDWDLAVERMLGLLRAACMAVGDRAA
ncbi:glycosyltransferase family 4 protein [Falsiroseomonas sp. CW058]|uniref:glycosyltransferase family 4 protein n=1 Tax=Falsiroseomonas sp. CW058 TaxID=3388664 RepID=UPI003D30F1B5